MKKVFFIAMILIGLTSSTTSILTSKEITTIGTDFCKGWEDGYCEGWKDVKGQLTLCPLAPLCPLPELGKDNYRGGYNAGFKAGTRAASK